MIKNIKYWISVTQDISLWYDVPYIEIDTIPDKLPDECIVELELLQLPSYYIREIVDELNDVKNWKKEYYDFWFETTFINVFRKWYKNDIVFFPDGKVSIDYNYWKSELKTDLKIDDILKMMTDYRDFVDAWEKETGKVKK